MIRKRSMAAAVSTVFALSAILAGCGSGNEQNAGSTTNTAISDKAGADNTLKPVNLTLYYPGSPQEDLPLVNEEINKYLTQKINATVELKPIEWGAWYDKTNLMFASNESFDMMFAAGWLNYPQAVARKVFQPVDDLMEKYGQDVIKNIPKETLEAGRIDGKLYAVATYKEFASAGGISMRKDLVDKYKLDLSNIKTIYDLDPVFEMIKKNEPNVLPLQDAGGSLSGFVMDRLFDPVNDQVAVIKYDTPNTKVVNLYAQPEVMEMAKLFKSWMDKGYINKDAATTKQSSDDVVKAGKAFSSGIVTKPGIESLAAINTGMPMVVIPLTPSRGNTQDATSAMFGISINSKNPERSMMFLNLLHSDKYLLNLLNFGIEGTHYVKIDENTIDYPSGLNATTSPYVSNNTWMFGNQLMNYIWPDQPKDLWDQYRELNASKSESPVNGFTFNLEPVKAEEAAVKNVLDEMRPGIRTGTLDPETYMPKLLDKLKSAGIDKIIAEKQKQIDEWMASITK